MSEVKEPRATDRLDPAQWPVVCIGPGRVGCALVRALREAGFPIAAVGGGSGEWARRLAEETGAEPIREPYAGVGASARLLLVTTPDRAFSGVAASLGEAGGVRPGSLLLHTSATEPAEVLRPAAAGAEDVHCGSMHPMRPFPDRERGAGQFHGTLLGVEGEGEGGRLAGALAGLLGGHVVLIPAGGKALYHAAGVMAATGVMGLAEAGRQIAERLGLGEEFVRAGILGGMRGALAAVEEKGLPEGLTGPISRGDTDVVARHLAALREAVPELQALYREIARMNLLIADQAGRPDPAILDGLRTLLRE